MEYIPMRFENICRLTDFLNDNNIKQSDIVGIYVRNQSQVQSEFDLVYIRRNEE